MADIFSPEKRSQIMRKICPKNSTYERIVQSIVSSLRFRYETNVSSLPGKPDLVFKRRKKVIFINGCFWHGHNKCKRSKLPSTNRDFWSKKIWWNIFKDGKTRRLLREKGWKYLIIWQCKIRVRNMQILENKIRDFLRN